MTREQRIERVIVTGVLKAVLVVAVLVAVVVLIANSVQSANARDAALNHSEDAVQHCLATAPDPQDCTR